MRRLKKIPPLTAGILFAIIIICWFIGGIITGKIAGIFFPSVATWTIILSGWGTIFFVLPPLFLITHRYGGWRFFFAWKFCRIKDFFFAATGWLLLLSSAHWLSAKFDYSNANQWQREIFTAINWQAEILLIITIILVAPLVEELLFRGFFFRARWSAASAALWSSLVWAWCHHQYNLAATGQVFLLGLYLGYTRWRWRSLPLCVILHLINNAAAIFLVS